GIGDKTAGITDQATHGSVAGNGPAGAIGVLNRAAVLADQRADIENAGDLRIDHTDIADGAAGDAEQTGGVTRVRDVDGQIRNRVSEPREDAAESGAASGAIGAERHESGASVPPTGHAGIDVGSEHVVSSGIAVDALQVGAGGAALRAEVSDDRV